MIMFQALKKRGGKREGAIFQLRYLHDIETKSEDFERIIDCSSELRSIFLDNPEEQTLDHIQHLHKLRKIKFNKIKAEILERLVKKIGGQLTEIELVTCRGSIDLATLSSYCSNLQVLEVYYSQNIVCRGDSLRKFSKLRKCVIYSTEISGLASNYLIENSPVIEHLNLSSASLLDKDKLAKLVESGALDNLQELAIMSAPLLDIDVVELLIDQLPRLKLLGRLEQWNVGASQLERLRKRVCEENYELLLWFNLPIHLELHFDQDLIDL